MNKFFLLLALILVACGASPDDEDKTTSFQKNPCVTAGAAYLEQFEEVSGNCGPMTDMVITVPSSGVVTIDGSCKGTLENQGCSVLLNQTCTFNDPEIGTYTEKDSGKMTWAEDGSSGSGMITVSLSAAGYEPCTSTYAVTATRL